MIMPPIAATDMVPVYNANEGWHFKILPQSVQPPPIPVNP
jgi:hypothetical protein